MSEYQFGNRPHFLVTLITCGDTTALVMGGVTYLSQSILSRYTSVQKPRLRSPIFMGSLYFGSMIGLVRGIVTYIGHFAVVDRRLAYIVSRSIDKLALSNVTIGTEAEVKFVVEKIFNNLPFLTQNGIIPFVKRKLFYLFVPNIQTIVNMVNVELIYHQQMGR